MTTIDINGEIGIWDVPVWWVQRQLRDASGDIEVRLNSPGGDVFEGIEIHNALADYDKGEVHVIIGAEAASIASYIAMAGDRISIRPNSTFMAHNVWTIVIGDYRDLRKGAEISEGLTSIIAQRYADVTSEDIETIRSKMDDEIWLFGDEIVTFGFASEVIPFDDDEVDGALTNRAVALQASRKRFEACQQSARDHPCRIDHAEQVYRSCVGDTCGTEPPADDGDPGSSTEVKYSRDYMSRRFNLITRS